MSHLLDSSAKGVYTISATPFTDSGDIDWITNFVSTNIISVTGILSPSNKGVFGVR